MWSKVIKFIISLFWPEIKKFLAKYIKELIVWIEKKIGGYIKDRNNMNKEKAEAAAADADKNASLATNEVDIAKYKAEAETWRKAAALQV